MALYDDLKGVTLTSDDVKDAVNQPLEQLQLTQDMLIKSVEEFAAKIRQDLLPYVKDGANYTLLEAVADAVKGSGGGGGGAE